MKLNKRRRREHKTNYRKRFVLLKGEYLRMVVRKTNRYVILQIIESMDANDKVLYYVNTKELLKLGWPENKKNSLKSISASYLGGFLLGSRTKKLEKNIILDSGLITSTKGSRIYAAVKGVIDSGIKINCDEKVFPSKEKIEGKNIQLNQETFNKIKEKIKGVNKK